MTLRTSAWSFFIAEAVVASLRHPLCNGFAKPDGYRYALNDWLIRKVIDRKWNCVWGDMPQLRQSRWRVYQPIAMTQNLTQLEAPV